MEKSNLPQGIRTLKKWYESNTLSFDNPIQRAGSQWNLLQQSLLMHSMLANYPIPAVYFLKERDSDNNVTYDCLDAKQRLTSIFDFIDGKYALHSATPEVELEGTTYDLANMYFSDLSEECQDAILGYRFTIHCLEGVTEEEVEEIFKRLNNSTPLTAIQKCRSILGKEVSFWLKTMCEHQFFEHSVSLSLAQVRKEANLEVLLQAMLLLDSRHENYSDWKGISTAEVTKYCGYIRNDYNENKRDMIREILDYLYEVFPDKCKFLKKSNIPTVIVLGKIALENDVVVSDFRDFIEIFGEEPTEEYSENCGAGNVKRAKTEGRLRAIASSFEDYCELENTKILNISGVSEEANENDQLDDEESSSGEDSEVTNEISGEEAEDDKENTYISA